MSNHIRIVGTFDYKNGKFVTVSADENRRDFNRGLAVFIPADQIEKYYPLSSDHQVYVGGLLNRLHLKPGTSFSSKKGDRIIIKVTQSYVIFLKIDVKRASPKFFIQKTFGFHEDWLDLVRINAAGKLNTVRVLAEWQVQFLVGVVGGVSWKGLALVIGVDVFEEAITQNKTTATKEAIRMLQVLFVFRRDLKQIAPTLASVITDVIWLSLLKGQGQHLLPAMLNDPKVAARAAGTITVQVGKQANGQFTHMVGIISGRYQGCYDSPCGDV